MGVTAMILARMRKISRMPAIIHCVVFAMISISFWALFIDRSALGLLQRDPTLTGRTELWDAIFRIQINPIIGTGNLKASGLAGGLNRSGHILVAADAGAQRLY